MYRFDITPMGKPRMTQQDKWRTNPNHYDPDRRQREVVTRYWQFKKDIQNLSLVNKFTLGQTLDITFYIPMPKSWSNKKKLEMAGKPCMEKPDGDNLAKAFMDCFGEDKAVWKLHIEKYWLDFGAIIVFTETDRKLLEVAHTIKQSAINQDNVVGVSIT